MRIRRPFPLDAVWRWSVNVGSMSIPASRVNRHLVVRVRRAASRPAWKTAPRSNRHAMTYEIRSGHDASVVGVAPRSKPSRSPSASRLRPRAGDVDASVLATVLFTDIVNCDGDAERGWVRSAWRRLQLSTTTVCRSELARFRGRAIDRPGEGILALFDGASRAIRCAAAIDPRGHHWSGSTSAPVCTPSSRRCRFGCNARAGRRSTRQPVWRASAASDEVLVTGITG